MEICDTLDSLEKSLLLEYACHYRMHGLIKRFSPVLDFQELVAGQNLSDMGCPRIPSLCATAASIVTNREREHLDKAVVILWELYKVFPGIVPFENFGNLIVDILICKILSNVEFMNMNDSTKVDMFSEVGLLFRVPKNVKELSKENRLWLNTKFEAISRKLLALAFTERQQCQHLVSLCVNMKNCNCFWENIKHRVDRYLDKVNLKIGRPVVEAFFCVNTKQNNRKEKHQVKQSKAYPAIDDLIRSVKKAATVLRLHKESEPDQNDQHHQQSETSSQSDGIVLNSAIENVDGVHSQPEIEKQQTNSTPEVVVHDEDEVEYCSCESSQESDDGVDKRTVAKSKDTTSGIEQENEFRPILLVSDNEVDHVVNKQGPPVAKAKDRTSGIEQENEFRPTLFLSDKSDNEVDLLKNRQELVEGTFSPEKQPRGPIRTASPVFFESHESDTLDDIITKASVAQCTVSLDNQTVVQSTESVGYSTSLDTSKNNSEVNEANLEVPKTSVLIESIDSTIPPKIPPDATPSANAQTDDKEETAINGETSDNILQNTDIVGGNAVTKDTPNDIKDQTELNIPISYVDNIWKTQNAIHQLREMDNTMLSLCVPPPVIYDESKTRSETGVCLTVNQENILHNVISLIPKNDCKLSDNSQASCSNDSQMQRQQEYTLETGDGQRIELLFTREESSSLPASKKEHTSLTAQANSARLKEQNNSDDLTNKELPTALPSGAHSYNLCDNSQPSNDSQQDYTLETSDGRQIELVFTREESSTSSLAASKEENTSLTEKADSARLKEQNKSDDFTNKELSSALPSGAHSHKLPVCDNSQASCSKDGQQGYTLQTCDGQQIELLYTREERLSLPASKEENTSLTEQVVSDRLKEQNKSDVLFGNKGLSQKNRSTVEEASENCLSENGQQGAELSEKNQDNFETAIASFNVGINKKSTVNKTSEMVESNEDEMGHASDSCDHPHANNQGNFETATTVCNHSETVEPKKDNIGNASDSFKNLGVNNQENFETKIPEPNLIMYGDVKNQAGPRDSTSPVNINPANKTLEHCDIESAIEKKEERLRCLFRNILHDHSYSPVIWSSSFQVIPKKNNSLRKQPISNLQNNSKQSRTSQDELSKLTKQPVSKYVCLQNDSKSMNVEMSTVSTLRSTASQEKSTNQPIEVQSRTSEDELSKLTKHPISPTRKRKVQEYVCLQNDSKRMNLEVSTVSALQSTASREMLSKSTKQPVSVRQETKHQKDVDSQNDFNRINPETLTGNIVQTSKIIEKELSKSTSDVDNKELNQGIRSSESESGSCSCPTDGNEIARLSNSSTTEDNSNDDITSRACLVNEENATKATSFARIKPRRAFSSSQASDSQAHKRPPTPSSPLSGHDRSFVRSPTIFELQQPTSKALTKTCFDLENRWPSTDEGSEESKAVVDERPDYSSLLNAINQEDDAGLGLNRSAQISPVSSESSFGNHRNKQSRRIQSDSESKNSSSPENLDVTFLFDHEESNSEIQSSVVHSKQESNSWIPSQWNTDETSSQNSSSEAQCSEVSVLAECNWSSVNSVSRCSTSSSDDDSIRRYSRLLGNKSSSDEDFIPLMQLRSRIRRTRYSRLLRSKTFRLQNSVVNARKQDRREKVKLLQRKCNLHAVVKLVKLKVR